MPTDRNYLEATKKLQKAQDRKKETQASKDGAEAQYRELLAKKEFLTRQLADKKEKLAKVESERRALQNKAIKLSTLPKTRSDKELVKSISNSSLQPSARRAQPSRRLKAVGYLIQRHEI